jgi:predicted nucleic acid-binding protein
VTSGVAVFDSSALIAFWQIKRLDLLSLLFAEIVVPSAVKREVAPSIHVLPSWIQVLPAPNAPPEVQALDSGEREAITLALELSADFVVLDELAARRLAVHLGLDVIGAAGLLLRAYDFGLIHSIREDLDAMIASGFYVSRRLYLEVLETIGESN